MNIKKNISILFISPFIILLLMSCTKAVLDEKKEQTEPPNPLSFSKNLIFDEQGYQQFRSDLADPNFKPLVKSLYEDTANAALRYTPIAFIDLSDDNLTLKTIKYNAATGDSRKVMALALKVMATDDSPGRKPYLDKATQIIKAWANVNVQSWHRPQESGLFGMYEAYSLIKPLMTTADKTVIDNWLRKRATTGANNFGLQDANAANKLNNWDGIRICFLFYTAYILQDNTLLEQARAHYKTFLNLNILNSDGLTYDLNQRDAFVYHAYMLECVASISSVVSNMENQDAALSIFYQKNDKGYNYEQSISLWEPYLNGMYHDEFAKSIVTGESTTRRKTYNPKGDLPVLDVLIKVIPGRIYPYIKLLSNNSSRFANVKRYVSMLNNPNPVIPTNTLGITGTGETYTFVTAVNNTSVLNVQNAATVSGTKVELYAPNSTNAQKWKVYNGGDGYFVINSALASTQVLEVKDGVDANGTQIQIANANYTKAQRWKVEDTGHGYYILTPACAPTKNLDLNASMTANVSNIQLWTAQTATALSQKWKLVKQ